MKSLQIFDPAMCCSTGVCGTEIDSDLVNFAALLSQLPRLGVRVERFNLGQQPIAFVQNPAVKSLLDQQGIEVLPVIFCDGELKLKGRYPNTEERAEWFSQARSQSNEGAES